ncbi:endonuclease, partial [Planoprotostelium fungivorum]
RQPRGYWVFGFRGPSQTSLETTYKTAQMQSEEFQDLTSKFLDSDSDTEELRRRIRTRGEKNFFGEEAMNSNSDDVVDNPNTSTFRDRYCAELRSQIGEKGAVEVMERAEELYHKLRMCDDTKSGGVMGQVQSGKTIYIKALAACHADHIGGLVIILTGRINSLRTQTQKRMQSQPKEGDSLGSAFDEGINFITGEDDIQGKNNGPVRKAACLPENTRKPGIAVIKKNNTSLDWLKKMLGDSEKATRTQQSVAGGLGSYLLREAIIIDDECDDASVNYHGEFDNPSKIYAAITGCISLWTNNDKTCYYLGLTATPQSIILSFVEGNSLFPEFIHSLPTDDIRYVGLNGMFSEGTKMVVNVPPEEATQSVQLDPWVQVFNTTPESIEARGNQGAPDPSQPRVLRIRGRIIRRATMKKGKGSLGLKFDDSAKILDSREFRDERFSKPDRKIDRNWCQALADASGKDLRIVEIGPQSVPQSKRHFKVSVVANEVPELLVLHSVSNKTYTLLGDKIVAIIDDPVEAIRQLKLFHCSLFHFSSRNAVSKLGYQHITERWAILRQQIEQLSPKHPQRQPPLRRLFDGVWADLDPKEIYTDDEFWPEVMYILENTQIKWCTSSHEAKEEKIKDFDYDSSDTNTPEVMIIVGGDMLGRGITLKGLTISYYVRTTKIANWDTTLQHCRWFGWHLNDHDLVRLFTTEAQLKIFKKLAEFNRNLCEGIARIEKLPGKSKDNIITLMTCPEIRPTQPLKMKNRVDMYNTTVRSSHNKPLRDPDGMALAVEALENLHDLYEREGRIITERRGHLVVDVKLEEIKNFILDFGERVPDQLVVIKRKIQKSMDERTTINLVFRGKMSRVQKTGDLKNSRHKIVRKGVSPHSFHGQLITLGAASRKWAKGESVDHILLEPQNDKNDHRRDELFDLSCAEKHNYHTDWFSQYHKNGEDRQKRSEDAPILLIFYILDSKYISKTSEAPDQQMGVDDTPYVGAVAFFPRELDGHEVANKQVNGSYEVYDPLHYHDHLSNKDISPIVDIVDAMDDRVIRDSLNDKKRKKSKKRRAESQLRDDDDEQEVVPVVRGRKRMRQLKTVIVFMLKLPRTPAEDDPQ